MPASAGTLMKLGPELGGCSSKDAWAAEGPLMEVGGLLAAFGPVVYINAFITRTSVMDFFILEQGLRKG